jgi:predicted lipase
VGSNAATGYVAADHTKKKIVLSMRGSVSMANWIADIKFVQTACPQFGGQGAACSIGFLGFWEQSRPDAMKGIKAALGENPSYELVVTGHSLGAVAAVYAASELRTAKYPNVLLV